MSKIILAVLTAAAFVYALWLVLFRRALPQPGRATGLRRRFYLATLLFVGLLTTPGRPAEQAPQTRPAVSLATMKARVRELLRFGPDWTDWHEASFRPSVSEALAANGLIDEDDLSFTACYDMDDRPAPARTEELKSLQQALLDQQVQAGVIDAETARKAGEAASRPAPVDYTSESDIRAYQANLRRVIRLLYQRGELPSSFVDRVGEAADVKIIDFDPSKALRYDMRYCLYFLLLNPSGEQVLDLLAQRGLIPKVRNHSLALKRWDEKGQPDRQRLDDFRELLERGQDVRLDGDDKVRIAPNALPQDNREYRLEIRRVVRALIHLHFVEPRQVKLVEKCLDIPIIGTLEASKTKPS